MSKITALYVRVSTNLQAEEGYSIDEQIDRLTKYADAMEWKPTKVYTDAGYSGASINRPAITDLIRDVEQGKIDRIVVYKLDRLSRSQADTLYLIEKVFLANSCDFVSMSENFDTSTPFGKAMIGILSVFAQLEREQIKERMAIGKQGRAKSGKYRGGGHNPTGYEYIDGELVINEYEAMQVREAHELYQQGKSFNEIAKIFRDKGYTKQNGEWQGFNVRRTILNKLYAGYITYKGSEYLGTHEPIISLDTYNKSYTIHHNNLLLEQRKKGKSSLLGSLLYCSHCGARYTKSTIYYSCYSRRKCNHKMIIDPNCKNKIWKCEELDNIILDEIRKLAVDPEYFDSVRDKEVKDSTDKKVKLINKQIAKIEKQKSRLIDLFSMQLIEVDELKSKAEPLDEEKNRLLQEIDALKSNEAELSESDAKEILSTFAELIDDSTQEEKRQIILSLISKIVIDNDDLDIYWRFS